MNGSVGFRSNHSCEKIKFKTRKNFAWLIYKIVSHLSLHAGEIPSFNAFLSSSRNLFITRRDYRRSTDSRVPSILN